MTFNLKKEPKSKTTLNQTNAFFNTTLDVLRKKRSRINAYSYLFIGVMCLLFLISYLSGSIFSAGNLIFVAVLIIISAMASSFLAPILSKEDPSINHFKTTTPSVLFFIYLLGTLFSFYTATNSNNVAVSMTFIGIFVGYVVGHIFTFVFIESKLYLYIYIPIKQAKQQILITTEMNKKDHSEMFTHYHKLIEEHSALKEYHNKTMKKNRNPVLGEYFVMKEWASVKEHSPYDMSSPTIISIASNIF